MSDSVENIFTTVQRKFEKESSLDGQSTVASAGSSEMLVGEQADGTPICVFRPNINLEGRLGSFIFSVIMGDPTVAGDTSEFVVSGNREKPVSFEVLEREPLETRNLSSDEAIELAKMIDGSTFLPAHNPHQESN